MLAGIIPPSEGSVDVHGHVSSLLTLGAGFDQELTGRDNILLGRRVPRHRRRRDRASGCPSIIEFADLGEFIDAPIKTYSSGMRARLGFSIATSVDPDILLLDEVLATGDAVFRAKSKARVIELVRAAKAIVLVTHDMNWVTEYCNRAILLEKRPGRHARATRPRSSRCTSEHSEREQAEKLAQEPTAARAQAAGRAIRERPDRADRTPAAAVGTRRRRGAGQPRRRASPTSR